MVDWIRPAGTIPGTKIVIYESGGPVPGMVWLVPHDIAYGSTNSWSLQKREVGKKGGISYNTIAGDPKIPRTVREHYERDDVTSGEFGPSWDLMSGPAKPTRPPGSGTEGLGAEDWRERQKREAEEFRLAQERAEKRQKYNGVRGYRAAVLGPHVERKLNVKTDTMAKWSALWKRIPPATWNSKGNRTWLENGTHMLKGDPLRGTSSSSLFQPWISESCVPWLILEGSRNGLVFATRPYDFENPDAVPGRYEESPATTLIKLVALYLRDRAGFASDFGNCKTSAERSKGLMLSNKELGLNRTEAIGMDAGRLFDVFRLALKLSENKAAVHEAYHRILLHKFLHRRNLVPKLSGDSVALASMRRAWVLQAHRLLVFNSSGCPVSFNQEVLEENGIRKLNRASLVFKDRVDLNLVDEWTRWLYGTVLEMPMETCARVVHEFKGQVSALAAAGHLS